MTLEQAKQFRDLTDEQKQALKSLEDSAKRFHRPLREFQATNANELKEELNQLIEIAKQRKAQNLARKQKENQTLNEEMQQCVNLLLRLIQDNPTSGTKALFEPNVMFAKLQQLEVDGQKEQKRKLVQSFLAESGITTNELREYLNQ